MTVTKLEELGDFKNGVNFKSSQMGSGVPLINVKNITDSHRIDVESLERVEVQVNEDMHARTDDLFFVRSSVKLDGIALSAQVMPSELPSVHCGFIIRFRPTSPKIHTPYLLYLLKSHRYRETLKGLSGGAAIVNISQSALKGLKIPVPSLTIQQRIADMLSAYDDLIENNRRRIELLEQSARLLYKEWFVHLRFPGHEHTPITNGVPEGWESIPLGEILTLQRGFDLPAKDRIEGEIPIYASTGITGFHNVAKVAGPGVVTGRSGSLGIVSYVAGDFWPLNTALWVKEFKKITPLLACHVLRSMRLEQYNGGAAVPTLNRNDVHRIESLSPQTTLIRMFDDVALPIASQIDCLNRQINSLSKARDLLLPRLMSGEIAV